jgi:hypothetical protein
MTSFDTHDLTGRSISGVYYYRYGKIDQPKIVDCHVDTGLNSVVSNALWEIELLDLTNDVPPETRSGELQDMVRTYAIPWLEGMAAFDVARSFLASNPAAAHVAPIARTDLRPQGPPSAE